MIYPVNNFSVPQIWRNVYSNNSNNYKRINNCSVPYDSVSFTARSLPSEYNTVFDYLAAEIAYRKKKYGVNGGMINAEKIPGAIKKLFEEGKVFSKYELVDDKKLKWKSYVPSDIRLNAAQKVNEARIERLSQWQKVLDNPKDFARSVMGLEEKLSGSDSLKFVIWDAVTSELKKDNRHIPVPLDAKALLETINRFETIAPKDRAVSCYKPSFVEYYTHRLRDNLLMKMGLSNREEIWVKIPSFRHDPDNKKENIRKVEILSNRNWCTRSSVDKAEDALKDGDFYIYLKRKTFNMWEPVAGMTTSSGKIDQIQGKDNDNIVPLDLVKEIRDYINDNGLKCNTQIVAEGPKAEQALFISEKLIEKLDDKTFFDAIKTNDSYMMFRFLGVDVEKRKSGLLKISNYRPHYLADKDKGFIIPYSMFGLNEDELLKDVAVIDGNLVLSHKNKLFSSRISVFPPKLREVKGNVICSQSQYEKFGKDINRVVGGDTNKIKISGV